MLPQHNVVFPQHNVVLPWCRREENLHQQAGGWYTAPSWSAGGPPQIVSLASESRTLIGQRFLLSFSHWLLAYYQRLHIKEKCTIEMWSVPGFQSAIVGALVGPAAELCGKRRCASTPLKGGQRWQVGGGSVSGLRLIWAMGRRPSPLRRPRGGGRRRQCRGWTARGDAAPGGGGGAHRPPVQCRRRGRCEWRQPPPRGAATARVGRGAPVGAAHGSGRSGD